VDAVEEEQILARSYADAPEIDGSVLVPGAWEIDQGDFIEVVVTESREHDLIARPVDD
jgi:ribosomal protein S12 methylthiotransferase